MLQYYVKHFAIATILSDISLYYLSGITMYHILSEDPMVYPREILEKEALVCHF